jgi:four helix bundle protein
MKVTVSYENGIEKKRPYEHLKFYKDICEIRKFIYEITERFEKIHLRLISQMRDAESAAKQNIREGYRKGTLPEFLNSIRISQGSLEELSGDFEDCFEDKLVTKEEKDKFSKMYNSAIYLSTQYLKTMFCPENQAKWKTLKSLSKR